MAIYIHDVELKTRVCSSPEPEAPSLRLTLHVQKIHGYFGQGFPLVSQKRGHCDLVMVHGAAPSHDQLQTQNRYSLQLKRLRNANETTNAKVKTHKTNDER